MRYPRGGILESVGSTTLGLDERGRPGDEDVCCQVEEWTKELQRLCQVRRQRGRAKDKTLGQARQDKWPADFIVGKEA